MDKEQALKLLDQESERLRDEYGVGSLLLYGSLARNEAGPTSDVDMLVEFSRPTGYFGLVRLQLHLQELLVREVDLGTPNSLRPALRERIRKESIRVA